MSEFLVIAATKYALQHRDLWLEWQCQEWLLNHWHMLTEPTKTKIRQSVENEFESSYAQMHDTNWPIVRKIWIGE